MAHSNKNAEKSPGFTWFSNMYNIKKFEMLIIFIAIMNFSL
jgi:hypothetical protein